MGQRLALRLAMDYWFYSLHRRADSLRHRRQLLRLRYSESGTLCRLGKLSLDVHAGPVVLESDWQYCFHDHRHSTRHGVEPGHRSSAQP